MSVPLFRTAAAIAAELDCSAKTIHRRARSEGWQSRSIGKRLEYIVPRGNRKTSQAAPPSAMAPPDVGLGSFITVEQRASIWRVNNRFTALDALNSEILQQVPIERALDTVAKAFHTSKGSLRRWQYALMTEGIGGLTEDKIGKVGRKKRSAAR